MCNASFKKNAFPQTLAQNLRTKTMTVNCEHAYVSQIFFWRELSHKMNEQKKTYHKKNNLIKCIKFIVSIETTKFGASKNKKEQNCKTKTMVAVA